ncbi:16S rRNA (adenine(1518)-N(6)/adenine(1519)-N(6))-dimethyltransferase RsmA [Pseudoflavonifractor phocaeensis]|uniref:16S rRNA (adenine(1518)-N(6)/adenine(1519)-N(6))- dimethyltransferase RsmA n=1 Tax=Pseudoflavonifractor phocaeensis TaxID=1870988 RepID=UPI0025A3B12A|nr:16S rRNA (adenine(1518)-N(6)/adenine(1519)-N(6))-dimethyltransferase RsmA [Pseudoflavonifractor phocaeensis]MDM8237968.1 16S rRNA (adenine(1518)-N(6)/adenine(1519)-N(6))-dimethyltransferase RsmA [Pseudoflavonifractor phocaeensis]
MDLCNINDIKALLARHGFRFSKSMGQNFLIEDWVPRDIAEASGAAPGVGVIEVGPGIGPLTRELSLRADKVVSIELDRSLLPILAETLSDRPNAEIFPGDVLKTDLPGLVAEKLAGLSPIACANLPYNITTPAITALIEAGCFQSITVMIQREVARRICAAPGTGDYGAFSVYCQYHTKPEILFDVPPSCFIPAPKVTSSVLRMVPQTPPAEVDDPKHFFRVVRAAFAQRRKTLLNSLSSSLGDGTFKEAIANAIAACGLPENIRGERLSISDFAALSKALRR